MSLASLNVGDEVVIANPARTAPVRAKVQRVGPRYITILGDLYRLDGACKDGYWTAYTVEQWEQWEATR